MWIENLNSVTEIHCHYNWSMLSQTMKFYENSYSVHVFVCIFVCVRVMFEEALFGSQVSLRTPRGTLAALRPAVSDRLFSQLSGDNLSQGRISKLRLTINYTFTG